MRIRDLVQGAAYRHINHHGATWVYREHAIPATYIFDVTNPDGTTDVWAFDHESVRDYLTPAPRTPEEIAWEAAEMSNSDVYCDFGDCPTGGTCDDCSSALGYAIAEWVQSQ
jgi:hypothetical protein